MTIDLAIRLTEILLALAILQQCAEHWKLSMNDRVVFGVRGLLCLALIWGGAPDITLVALLITSVLLLHRFAGPYNGGSDRMTLLVLMCLTAAHLAPNPMLEDLALGYLSIQLVFSYVISGWVKLRNPDWRQGRALADVFRFSAYPVSEALRLHADRTTLVFTASWTVMLFEIAFPLFLLDQKLLFVGLACAGSFHLANACMFGLNRFFWIWLTAYPALIWFQDRFIAPLVG